MMLSDAKSEEDMWGSARKVNNLCHKKEVSPPHSHDYLKPLPRRRRRLQGFGT